jgi:dTDP-4-amino-4,6-dideoxygalactose transaminase
MVIEDAAQAVLSHLNDIPPAGYGQFATYSFFPGKNLGAYGDAGAIVSNHPELFTKAKMYANHGRISKYDHEFEGINSRMDGIQGAILDVKLKYLEQWTQQRKEIASLYSELLDSVREIETPAIRKGASHVFHIYAIRTRADLRDQLVEHLRSAGIATGIHYPIALPNLKAYQYLGYHPEDFPKATTFSKELISLPIFPELRRDEVEYVAEYIRTFFAGKGKF